MYVYLYLGLKKKTCVSTNPTDPVFLVLTLQFLLPSRKKNEKIFIPNDPKMFQKIGQKNLKNFRIAKLNSLAILNFIICLF